MPRLGRKYFPAVFRAPFIGCHLMTVVMATACTAAAAGNAITSSRRSIGLDDDPDALLRIVADLARTGVDALCNQAYLEDKLGIKIEAGQIDTYPSTQKLTAEVVPKSTEVEFARATYSTFSNASENTCTLVIFFKKNLLCDVGSARLEKILGVKTEYTSPFPGRSTMGVFYHYSPASGDSSGIDLGTSDSKCAAGFAVGATRFKK